MIHYDLTVNVPTIFAGLGFAWSLFSKIRKIGAEIDKIPNLERRLRRIEFRLKIEPTAVEDLADLLDA